MDPITQGLLGTNASQALYAKKLNKYAAFIGFVAGVVPDLDLVINSPHNPTLFMLYHRQFSHALFFIPFGGLIIALLFLAFVKRLRCHWPAVIIAAMVAYGTHGFIDATTTYGTVLFWPFSDKRVAWDVMSIVDPVFTILLFIGAFFSWRKNNVWPARITLVLAVLYIGFGAFQHHRAQVMQTKIASARQQKILKAQVMPNLGNLFSWRSVYIADNTIYLDKITTPLFSKGTMTQGFHLPLITLNHLPQKFKNNPTYVHDFKVFKWFTHDFIAVFSTKPYIIADMRYVLYYHPVTSLWGIEFPVKGNRKHVYFKRRVVLITHHV